MKYRIIHTVQAAYCPVCGDPVFVDGHKLVKQHPGTQGNLPCSGEGHQPNWQAVEFAGSVRAVRS